MSVRKPDDRSRRRNLEGGAFWAGVACVLVAGWVAIVIACLLS
jgi:hypothetical protein